MKTFKDISRRSFLKVLLMSGSAAMIDWTELGLLASAIPSKQDFPIVVIGAGLGGLVSAAYLAKSGFPVTLIEQHSIPGGYATSFERKEGKFEFDVSLHATVAENAIPQRILSDLGVWKSLKVSYTPELRRIITTDHDITLPAKNPEEIKKRLSSLFPKEKTGIIHFYSEMEIVIKELWSHSSKKPMIKKLENISLDSWMSMHVKSPELKKIFSTFCGYYGTSPAETNALFYAIATGEYLVFGGQYYKTRSQDLSNALADAVYENNGQIIFDTEVKQILVSKKSGKDSMNSIDGVKDFQNKIYPARAVIANSSAPVVFEKMLPDNAVPDNYLKKVKSHRKSLSSFVVWLGLNREITHIKDYEIDISKDARYDKNHLYSGTYISSDISVTLYDNLFKGYSLPGTSTMSIMSLADYSFWEKFEKDYFKGNKDAYNLKKYELADKLIKQVEELLIPGLKKSIEVMEIGTPLTNIRYTKNPGGAIYGFDRNKEHLGSRTPIKGLYLASAWSNNGGYTPAMMAGRNAAKHLLHDFKKLL